MTKIGQITAQSGGVISSDAGFTVTARGVCWNTTGNPSITDAKTTDGIGAGSFTSKPLGLTVGTTYYLRAYATNSKGTAYGNTMIFKTLDSTFTDLRDGNVYKMVTIGDQIWMAENLAYAPSSGNYWAYHNDIANVETYGYLYNCLTALKICPAGWHLPSNDEWKVLTANLGDNAGGKLKATGTIEAGTGLWYEPNTGAINETGFSALPGGFRNLNGIFFSKGKTGYWWSAPVSGGTYVFYRNMYNDNGNVTVYGTDALYLCFSVRCLRD